MNVNLKDVNCYSNDLTTLDISKNVNLQYLAYDLNYLTIMDMSKNINLRGLRCENSLVSTLNVNNNVNLEWLYYSDNQLTTLDVSKNTNLQSLHCKNNDLSLFLNLTKNTKLNKIEISGNSTLQTVFVWQNPLPQGVTLTKDAAATLVVPKSTSATPFITTFSSGYYTFDTTGAIINLTKSPSNNGTLKVTANSNPTVVGALPNGIITLAQERYWSFSGGLTGLKYDLILDLSLLEGITDFSTLKVLQRFSSNASWYVMSNTIEYHEPYIVIKDVTTFGDFAIGGDANNPSLPIVEETRKNVVPTVYGISQNYPNPFNPTTTITYQIPTNTFVTLKVYDILGKEITTLVYKEMKAGSYTVNFDASQLSGGMYFYKLTAGNFSEVKKMMVLK